MATYASLTPQQQGIVQNLVNFVRAGSGEVSKIFNHVKAIADDTNGLSIFATLTGSEVIPNTSGLAGAADMTATEIATLYNILNNMRNTVDLNNGTLSPVLDFRGQATKASGINSMLG